MKGKIESPKKFEKPVLAPALKQFNEDHPRPLPHQFDELPADGPTCHVFNFLIAYMFREHRDKLGTKRWFMRVLDKDFQMLKNNGNIGSLRTSPLHLQILVLS